MIDSVCPVRLGAVFPQTEIGDDPAAIRDWAQAVEGLGYRHVLAYDHVLGAGVDTRPGWAGYTSEEAFHEIFVLFGFLAAVTSTVELVTGVLVLPQRQTALVAKQAAEIDVLSGGRLRLGVGVGWNRVEYEALGESFTDRGARIEEQVALLRRLWADPLITYSGRWHHVDNAGIRPRPVRGTIPIWFGGNAEAALRRTGQVGATGGSRNARPTMWRATCSSACGPTRERPAAILRRSVSSPGFRWRRCRKPSGQTSPRDGRSSVRRTCA